MKDNHIKSRRLQFVVLRTVINSESDINSESEILNSKRVRIDVKLHRKKFKSLYFLQVYNDEQMHTHGDLMFRLPY